MILVVEKAVAHDAAPRHTMNCPALDDAMGASRLTVMTHEIMPRRKIEALQTNLSRGHHGGVRFAPAFRWIFPPSFSSATAQCL
jgi:hypothetical protein